MIPKIRENFRKRFYQDYQRLQKFETFYNYKAIESSTNSLN